MPWPTPRSLLALVVVALAAVTSCGSAAGSTTPVPTTVAQSDGTSALAGQGTSPVAESPSVLTLQGALAFEIVATYPHDPTSYTQGLEIHDGTLYESVGGYGESERRAVDLETGDVINDVSLPDDAFGEGLTVVGDELYQLTWKEGIVFISDRLTLDEKRTLALDTEGWGVCFNGTTLVTSDGSSTLRFREPSDLRTLREVTVTVNDVEQEKLNELECVGDVVFANVFTTSYIVMIDPATGVITATLDLTSLVPESAVDDANEVLNGIAYRAETDTFLVTGKRWDTVYELRLASA